MKKYKILAVMLFSALGYANAQDNNSTGSESSSGDFKPAAGDISGAILFGRGNFLNSGLILPLQSQYWNNSWASVPGTAPYANTVDANDNSVNNIVGMEARYFLTDNIALKLSGGAIIRNTPARPNIPGYTTQGTDPGAWIPAYASVQADNQADINVNIGGEYHFTTKYSRLYPYVGATLPYYYARRAMYDPTIDDSGNGNSPVIVDVGVRSVEIVGFGLQAAAGVDYYLMEGLYFGFEIKPISYVYAYSNKIPAPGLESLKADTNTWSFFSQTFFKVGFRF